MKNQVIKDMQVGDVFSETSHYIFVKNDGINNVFKHIESGKEVTLTDNYVVDLLITADQYFKEEEVGKEDKKDGTLGIRSIFENISTSDVFTVCFRKAAKSLSNKAYTEAKEKQIKSALDQLDKVYKAKKGVTELSKKLLKEIQDNPILQNQEGESRILKGYKTQFTSRDGRYDCMDMEYPDGANGTNIRPVNINSIEWLVYKGTKYTVK